MSLPKDILDDFVENTNIFRSDQNRIDQKSFEAMFEKYGEDVAIGYLKCMQDVTAILNRALMAPSTITPDRLVDETDAMIANKVYYLHNALLDFMNQNNLHMKKLAKPYQRNARRKGWE